MVNAVYEAFAIGDDDGRSVFTASTATSTEGSVSEPQQQQQQGGGCFVGILVPPSSVEVKVMLPVMTEERKQGKYRVRNIT